MSPLTWTKKEKELHRDSYDNYGLASYEKDEVSSFIYLQELGGTVGGLIAITWKPDFSRYLQQCTQINHLYKVCEEEEEKECEPAPLKGFRLIAYNKWDNGAWDLNSR